MDPRTAAAAVISGLRSREAPHASTTFDASIFSCDPELGHTRKSRKRIGGALLKSHATPSQLVSFAAAQSSGEISSGEDGSGEDGSGEDGSGDESSGGEKA